jgi:hypothetical protein
MATAWHASLPNDTRCKTQGTRDQEGPLGLVAGWECSGALVSRPACGWLGRGGWAPRSSRTHIVQPDTHAYSMPGPLGVLPGSTRAHMHTRYRLSSMHAMSPPKLACTYSMCTRHVRSPFRALARPPARPPTRLLVQVLLVLLAEAGDVDALLARARRRRALELAADAAHAARAHKHGRPPGLGRAGRRVVRVATVVCDRAGAALGLGRGHRGRRPAQGHRAARLGLQPPRAHDHTTPVHSHTHNSTAQPGSRLQPPSSAPTTHERASPHLAAGASSSDASEDSLSPSEPPLLLSSRRTALSSATATGKKPGTPPTTPSSATSGPSSSSSSPPAPGATPPRIAVRSVAL